ncbi:unnamed protein product [Spirodela intermedia]|uniref:Glutaredoxin domain-containing protein n=1 Tax=Spirodela intermedia TaxID=51605 RepID=A0A7I8I900_SPIIN|nr:unnamed protein product [Spirodela intermedia]CAA6654090.1 unnamed protein product [Spirodela intermedia]
MRSAASPLASVGGRVVVHHPAVGLGDSHHVVSLTSTTYGYSLLPAHRSSFPPLPHPSPPQEKCILDSPSSSPSAVIDAWELMDGLNEEASPVKKPPPSLVEEDPKRGGSARPLWMHLSEESLLADLHPSVASALRQSPDHSAAACGPKVVFYTTSLRGVRRTYEDCRAVGNILRGLKVAVDERDVSMDLAFRRELQARVGRDLPPPLPQVFVGERLLGGAEELVCGACGGVRFLVCGSCSGSRKIFSEEGQLRRCSDCNDNGLVRCPGCC